jgi:lipoprotein-releasing system permease protein
MLKTKEDMEGVLLKGLDSTYDVNILKPFIRDGRFIRFTDSSYSKEILLSESTASKLKLKVNDGVLIYFFKPDSKPRVNKVIVTGIYKTGITEYDDLFAIADIGLIQWSKKDSSGVVYTDEIGGYEIFLNDYTKIDKTAKELYEMDEFPDTWDTVSTKNISPNIFDWLNLMDKNRNLLIGLMLIVAIINLITCLIILVLERVKMTGILKALGATDWTVQKIFLRHSLIITISGIVIGVALALGLLWLQKTTGFIKLQEDAYYINTAAVKIVWWQVGIICAGTFLVCLLVLLIPTYLVKKIQPVKAIQFR